MEKNKRKDFRVAFNISLPSLAAVFTKPALSAPARSKASRYSPALLNHKLSALALSALKTISDTPPPSASSNPAISVIIPMYNAEKYIGECLDSLVIQTLQDFEVIVIDNLSTDNSVKIVESYAKKFNGRLKILKTKKNLGHEALSRNFGLSLARGEYVYFMDADDFILGSALETLYNAAKEYDAEVVYSGSHYKMLTSNDVYLHRDVIGIKLLTEGLEDKPDLIVNDTHKLLQALLIKDGTEGNFSTVWTKFYRRDFLIRNNIEFPLVKFSNDFIWCINVYCHVKRFLRISAPFYFYRKYNPQSLSNLKKEPSEQIPRWILPFITWLRYLKELENKNEILSKNPVYCFTAIKRQFGWVLMRIQEDMEQVSAQEIYEILSEEFSKQNDLSDNITPFFMSFISADRKARTDETKELRETIKQFTARIDVKLMSTAGDFQILSVSDDKANLAKPAWFQKRGIGYTIQSYAGQLEIIAKATVDGQITLCLMGLNVCDPEDNSKRIPYWIDYTGLIVNGKTIFDTLTPAWHDKPYTYTANVKADEEITLQVEWHPHKNKAEPYNLPRSFSCPMISVIIPMYNVEKYIGECLDSLLAQTFKYFEVIVVDDCSTDNSFEVVKSYIPKFDGRLILASMKENSGGCAMPRNKGIPLSRGEYIQFVDSDDVLTKTALEEMYTLAKEYDADVVYCEKYYMSTGTGKDFIENIYPAETGKYLIQEPPFVDKPTLETEDLSERVQGIFNRRFWVTAWVKFVKRKLIIDNEIFFPHVAPAEDNIWTYGLVFYAKKFLRVPNMIYIRRVRDDSVMGTEKSPQQTINFWLSPVLRGLKSLDNLMSKHEFFKANPEYRYAVLEYFIEKEIYLSFRDARELSAAEVYATIKQKFGEHLGEYDVLIPALCATIFNKSKQIPRKFISYLTARIDIKLMTTEGDFQILSVSDKSADVLKPAWFQKDGIGYQIQSHARQLKFVAKAEVDGQIQLWLRGLDIRDPTDKSRKIPHWIDYTKLTINGQIILDKLTPAWHDKSYLYKVNAKSGEEIKIQVEWLPHRSYT